MDGELIFTRSITETKIKDSHGNRWQYHSRSDRHSKVACWAILFDLLQNCSVLREQVAAGKVSFGINHEMRDFKQDRKKNLDLVLCRRKDETAKSSFADYVDLWGIALDAGQTEALAKLPPLRQAAVSNVLIALEAKACMTEHGKAVPRLHDELSSSHQTIHGDTGGAIAAGFVVINCAETFISPDRNRKRVRGGNFVVNQHAQPAAAEKMLGAIMKIPRRSDDAGAGFDALGISMVDCANDGSPVAINAEANAKVSEIVKYDAFIRRLAHIYAAKYSTF